MLKLLLRGLLLGCIALAGSTAADEFTGRTFRATGTWDGATLKVHRLQLRDGLADPAHGQISGPIDGVEPRLRRFTLGPLLIRWDDATRFDGLGARDLTAGAAIRVNVEWDRRGPRAAAIRRAPAELRAAVQLTGVATDSRRLPDGGRRLTLLGINADTAAAGYNAVESLTRRQDSRRPETRASRTLSGRPFGTSAEYEMQLRDRRNFDLDSDDYGLDTSHEFQVEAIWEPTPRMTLFVSGKAAYEADIERTGGRRSPEIRGERDQMWLFLDRIAGTGIGLQIGRQNFKESREWWWDDDLDALRLYYDRGPWHLEVAAAQEVATVSTDTRGIDPEQRDVRRYLGTVSWLWAPRQKLEGYFLRADDRSRTEAPGEMLPERLEDDSDAQLTWYGLRAIGSRPLGRLGELEYWADLARVTGGESAVAYRSQDDLSQVTAVTRHRVRGTAFDVGLSWETPLPGAPSLTLGYARGSGDHQPDDGQDGGFRQTGLHNNKWRFFGVNRFRFYGEALRPELSNLGIATLSAGLPLLDNSSIELAVHRYRQAVAATTLRGARIDAPLTGESRDVGDAIDLSLGIREARSVDVALTAGLFRAGRAFGAARGQKSWLFALEATWNF